MPLFSNFAAISESERWPDWNGMGEGKLTGNLLQYHGFQKWNMCSDIIS